MFCSCYDHQTEEETPLLLSRVDISVVPSQVHAFGVCVLTVQARDAHMRFTLLLLDQIKPIEQLVPVS